MNQMTINIVALLFFVGATPVHADLVWDAATVTLESHQIGQGVYAVVPQGAAAMNDKGLPVATSGGFVVGDQGVLVVESMINKALAEQVQALVRQVTDKPIRYVVNTSYHGDHSYGNYAFPRSTSIIQHRETRKYIMNPDIFRADKAFMMQYFGTNRGIEEVVARSADLVVDDHLTVDLGKKEVVILHWGFAQTPGDLFIWIPQDKILWTGNPVIARTLALPWLLEGHHQESLATLKKMRAFLPSDAIIVPGHGVPMTPADLDFTVRYLETLDKEVRVAVAQGLSLEETKKMIQMSEFRGYALFDWVHPEVNVKAVYEAIRSQTQR